MDDCNGLPTPTRVVAPLGTDENYYENYIYPPNSHASVIGMILYLESNTRPDISFDVHQCEQFTHNTKISHDTAVKRICRYTQGNNDKGLVFNTSKKLVVEYYADADFAVLWGHENPQDPICYRSRTEFVSTYSNCPLLWVSKLQTEISISTINYDYGALSDSVRDLLPLKSLIKEVIDNW